MILVEMTRFGGSSVEFSDDPREIIFGKIEFQLFGGTAHAPLIPAMHGCFVAGNFSHGVGRAAQDAAVTSRMDINTVEYVWIDGSKPVAHLRSKTKTVLGDGKLPVWNFDGSSTGQADGGDSDRFLHPVKVIPDPIRGSGSIALCDVRLKDGTPHSSNHRARLVQVLEAGASKTQPWFGFEQEYTFFKDGRPLGWPIIDRHFPKPQGPYYCGVGADEAPGRNITEAHYQACLDAGLQIYGVNAEVMLGQWEFQVGPRSSSDPGEALDVADQLWLARYLLFRVAEPHGVVASLDVKPVGGDWNGAGCHTNFSTKAMREPGGKAAIFEAVEKLSLKHQEHLRDYGAHLEKRLTGEHETCSIQEFKSGIADRTASIRIPSSVEQDGKGYLEDRRPGANCDPYRVTARILDTICL